LNVITVDDVRELLDSDAGDPTLVVVSGQAKLFPGAELRDRGEQGEVIVRRDDLVRLTTADLANPSESDLRELAARLDAAVSEPGN
jgi:hypothetical protein